LPLVEAALLSYHSASFMSTSFFKLFPKLFVVCCSSATFNNIPRCLSINQAFFKKREKKKTSILSL
ncbi:hypothetical protein, partial [Bacillus velezensis]|uniref:hypothetical protein n=1 Tax=Bacillus velezensis TaxID=492670 RepID=UPI002DB68392